MTVDFRFARAPAMTLATVSWKGPWNESRIRKEFEGLAAWAKQQKLKSGRWVFMEAPSMDRWTVAVEVPAKAKGGGRVRLRHLPATPVASVVFDPDVVSPRVVYHGLSDWLRWRKRQKEVRKVLGAREVYRGNPWTDPKAWARTEVQFVVVK